MKKIETILEKYRYKKSKIIQILSEIQKVSNYLPQDVLEYVSQQM